MSPASKQKALGLSPQGSKKTSKPRDFNKSTATQAQYFRIIRALRRRPNTSFQLLRLGVYHVPRRIKDLRELGFVIHTHRVPLIDADGFEHRRCALYSLISEPENADELLGIDPRPVPGQAQADLFAGS